MSYSKTNWSSGDKITAERLNKIEQGVYEAGGGDLFYVDYTFAEPAPETAFTIEVGAMTTLDLFGVDYYVADVNIPSTLEDDTAYYFNSENYPLTKVDGGQGSISYAYNAILENNQVAVIDDTKPVYILSVGGESQLWLTEDLSNTTVTILKDGDGEGGFATETSYADIVSAYNAGKYVVARIQTDENNTVSAPCVDVVVDNDTSVILYSAIVGDTVGIVHHISSGQVEANFYDSILSNIL